MHKTLEPPPAALLDGASLFLDFDGTLVELVAQPDAVRVEPHVRDLLARLIDRFDGRVAIITGRPVRQIRGFLAADTLTVVGSHGIEFGWADGREAPLERPAMLPDILAAMQDLAERNPGVLVEEKPFGIALHYRERPGAEAECVALAKGLAEQHALHLQPGKMMIEVRAAGGDKGSAVRALMAAPEFAGTSPVFLGDDLTDEPGFVAADELGGAGILVGEPRASAARYRLAGVEETIDWLSEKVTA